MRRPTVPAPLTYQHEEASRGRQSCESVSDARIAYVITANPFLQGCNYPEHPLQNGDKVPATSVLPIHLRLIAALKLRLLAILVCMPNDIETSEVPGYRQFGRRMPDGLPLEVLQMPNNSLGSYGEFLHAFATTRGRFDYYIMTEEDYVPSNPYVTDELVRIYRLAFPGKQYGMLAGSLIGRRLRPTSPTCPSSWLIAPSRWAKTSWPRRARSSCLFSGSLSRMRLSAATRPTFAPRLRFAM
mmetsp:Transcript_4864/g.10572  ORF Transcript_4864/g.10572 Transcript_4864/m.10572 type:complete len:242 (-) Transcript_4864:793-1518(-)